MTAEVSEIPEVLRCQRQLAGHEEFCFACHPGVPCFNRCCADVNIFLTPVDVLRLARRLGLASGEFLDRYTLAPITKDLHLPVLMLRMGEEPEKRCPFVGAAGCEGGRTWTVESWRVDQRVEEQEEMEADFRELVSHPWFIGGRQLDPKRMELFFTACYDLDTFRRFVFDSSFLQRFELDAAAVVEIRRDDRALLRFAFRWLRFALFGEPTMTIRKASEP